MKNSLLYCLVGFIAVSADASVEAEKLKDEVVRTEAEFFEHALRHGLSTALHAYMAPDGFVANSLVLGRDALAAKAKADEGKPRPNVIRWKPLRAEVAASGDLGYTWGVAEAGPGAEGPFKPYGIYVTIWQRQPDGKWKFVYDAATILTAEAVEKFMKQNFPEGAKPKA
ncbi:MAG TPA: DUF4440 domain-containing protein [Opitutaceae bacterium]|nr:DUF4440 domain-containing protein [Opitutaceae bacterium]